MSKYVTDEAMRSAMTLQKGYIDKGDNTNAEGIDSIKKGKNLLPGVLTGSGWSSAPEMVQDPTRHPLEITDWFSIKEANDRYIVSPQVQVIGGKTYTFSFDWGGAGFNVYVVGSQNTYSMSSSGSGKDGVSFTPDVTDSVLIFIGGVPMMRYPQLELGSQSTPFTASTEELKKYHDNDTKEREATLLERVTELEDRMEEVVQTQLITTPPATLNAQVGYYYCMGGSGVVVDTMTIQLPSIADYGSKVKNVQFFMTMGSAPEVTFVSAGTERILYQKDFALEAERSYEVNALWNGHAWVITVVEIIVPFFAKLSLNNGEVVEFQGSGQLTSAMVSPYKSSLVSAEIGELCTSIGSFAFQNCSGLTSITIPGSVTSISGGAFNSCTGLTSITIGSGVTIIGNFVFQNCSGLTSITIPDSVTSISSGAFDQCSGLTSITIGSGVTSIGNEVFNGCTGLTSITSLATTAPTIAHNTFYRVKTNGTLTVPVGSTGYDVWMGTGDYYLGYYNWTKVEQ